jgi:hypothetical protein
MATGMVFQADNKVCMLYVVVALEMPMKKDQSWIILKYH